MKQTPAYKRRRKHKQLAKTKQQLFEEGVDRENRMGTYETGVAILANEETQQSSNSPNEGAPNSSRTKICGSCGGTGHKTWRAKACARNDEYLASKQQPNPPQNNNNNNTQLVENNETEKVRNTATELVSGEAVAVGEAISVTVKAEAIAAVTMKMAHGNNILAKALEMNICVPVKNEKFQNKKSADYFQSEVRPVPMSK